MMNKWTNSVFDPEKTYQVSKVVVTIGIFSAVLQRHLVARLGISEFMQCCLYNAEIHPGCGEWWTEGNSLLEEGFSLYVVSRLLQQIGQVVHGLVVRWVEAVTYNDKGFMSSSYNDIPNTTMMSDHYINMTSACVWHHYINMTSACVWHHYINMTSPCVWHHYINMTSPCVWHRYINMTSPCVWHCYINMTSPCEWHRYINMTSPCVWHCYINMTSPCVWHRYINMTSPCVWHRYVNMTSPCVWHHYINMTSPCVWHHYINMTSPCVWHLPVYDTIT